MKSAGKILIILFIIAALTCVQGRPQSNQDAGQVEVSNETEQIQREEVTVPTSKNNTYNYLLLTCTDRKNHFVLTEISNDGVQSRRIETNKIFGNFAEFRLLVKGGKLYLSFGTLYAIDTEDGEVQIVNFASNDDKFNLIETDYSKDLINGRLYGFSGPILRVVDFNKKAYRDIATLEQHYTIKHSSVSPDQNRFAYFEYDPNGYNLTVININSGRSVKPLEPVKFSIPVISSFFYGPPLTWLDNDNILFIRTEDQNNRQMDDDINMLVQADLKTGVLKDIAPLPGKPAFTFPPSLTQDNIGVGPKIEFRRTNIPIMDSGENLGIYRLDMKTGKLIEDNNPGGDYNLSYGYLYHGDKELGPAERQNTKISPDGKFAAWIYERTLFYYNGKEKTEIELPGGLRPWKIHQWLKEDDLQERNISKEIPAGWKALSYLPYNEPSKQWVDNRKPIEEHLKFEVKTDKDVYRKHEQVQITVILTNIGVADVNVFRPVVYDSIFSRISEFRLKSPISYGLRGCGAEPYSPKEERVILKTGQSLTAKDVLEVPLAGDYTINFEYKGWSNPGVYNPDYKGRLKAEPVIFQVISNEDAQMEQQLFDAKFNRLMAKFRKELSIAPNWDGGNDTVGDDTSGIPGMGPKSAPYIVEALKTEQNKIARKLLFRALRKTADASDREVLSFIAERLIGGEAEEVCSWLYEQYNKHPDTSIECEAVLDIFLAGMEHENTDIRREVCKYLIQIYDDRVLDCFEKAVYDNDLTIRLDAAHYLAAAKWLVLDEWIEKAAKEPTYIRYLAAVSIFSEIEKTFNITKAGLPDLKEEDFAVNSEKLSQLSKILKEWKNWTDENQSYSFNYFEKYRQKWTKQ